MDGSQDEDEDRKYAEWLQQQELLSIQNDDEKYAAQIQCELGDGGASHFGSQNYQSDWPQEQGPSVEADWPQTEKDDEHIAQDIEQDTVDGAVANCLMEEELEILSKDERLAQEISSQQLAYKEQLKADEEFAKMLSKENPDHRRHQHTNNTPFGIAPPTDPFGATPRTDPFVNFGSRGHRSPRRPRNDVRPRGPPRAAHYQGFHATASQTNSIQSDFAGMAADIPDDYESLLQLGDQLGEAVDAGLHDNELDTLPTQTYRSPEKANSRPDSDNSDDSPTGEGRDTDCKICYEGFVTGNKLRILPCLHQFHQECIDKWLKTKATCPICSLEIKEELMKNSSVRL